ncbi:CocE/NonD family hydrolase [Pigmentiphaga sp. YJ18]|uniref:CocE/NonD family hydrolase n=1 Tax=Pigmentiphaga sp. YJ18 TaxID=3134907 RepID=UPI003117A468
MTESNPPARHQAAPHALVFEKDVEIPMDDGAVLKANVFRPAEPGRYPVVMAQGVYGKDVHFADGFKPQWEKLQRLHPGLCQDGSSGRYLRWETVDPERWVPDGYVVIHVDARGSGKSPGYLDPMSPREIQDYRDAIEWAGTQSWSNGKVGLIGISYYAATQWRVAALRPKHLAAIVPWEGRSDHYRDYGYHGGIRSNGFLSSWWPKQVLSNQHGNGDTPYRDRDDGQPTTGPALSATLLAANRSDYPAEMARHALCDAWHKERTPDLSRITVPVLSAGNWGGPGNHLRGNIEGYLRAGSAQKWLSMHIGTHYESFYLPRYIALQKQFFDHFLKGLPNGWDQTPPVLLSIRTVDGETRRAEHEFPLARTQWTRFYLHPGNAALDTVAPAQAASAGFQAQEERLDFTTPPFETATEITGFIPLRIWVSSSTRDVDLFAVLRLFDPDGKEIVFDGAHEPTPLTRGWLRASHRKVDEKMSMPNRIFHTHDEIQKIEPGTAYPLDLEIWPTSIVIPRGYRLRLTIQGKDFEFEGIKGRLTHTDPTDRGGEDFQGRTTLYSGPEQASYLTLPIIPARD